MPTSPTPAPRASAAPELRRHLLHLVLAVVALHAAMIGLYRGLRIEARPQAQRNVFLLVWTGLAVAVVLLYLARVRAARIRARRARAGGR